MELIPLKTLSVLFEEPEDAPELKEIRSANVTEHAGDFWNTPEKNNTGPVPSGRTAVNESRSRDRRIKARPRTFRLIAGGFVFIAALVLILRFAVFSVKEIYVNGNSTVSAEEVIRASGMRRGDYILSLNEKTVEERITSDYRLQFRYMATQLPSTVVISVREREPCCWLTYCGIMYVMDKNRMVLYESENPSEQPQNLVEIKGLEVRSNTMVGQYVNLGNEQQKSIFRELFQEMKVLNCIDKIADADISNTNSILLATRNGFTVALGDGNNIHAKLRSMLLVQDKLVELGYSSGTINVTNPEKPMFIPE